MNEASRSTHAENADAQQDPEKMLKLIAQGYFFNAEYDRFVICTNPDYKEDDGSSPHIVYDTYKRKL